MTIAWTPTKEDEAEKLRQYRAAKAKILLIAKPCPECGQEGFFGPMQPRKEGRVHEAWCKCGQYKAAVAV